MKDNNHKNDDLGATTAAPVADSADPGILALVRLEEEHRGQIIIHADHDQQLLHTEQARQLQEENSQLRNKARLLDEKARKAEEENRLLRHELDQLRRNVGELDDVLCRYSTTAEERIRALLDYRKNHRKNNIPLSAKECDDNRAEENRQQTELRTQFYSDLQGLEEHNPLAKEVLRRLKGRENSANASTTTDPESPQEPGPAPGENFESPDSAVVAGPATPCSVSIATAVAQQEELVRQVILLVQNIEQCVNVAVTNPETQCPAVGLGSEENSDTPASADTAAADPATPCSVCTAAGSALVPTSTVGETETTSVAHSSSESATTDSGSSPTPTNAAGGEEAGSATTDSLPPTNAAGGDKETDDAGPQCTNTDSKQSMQCCSVELTESDLHAVVLHALSLIYNNDDIEKLKNAIKNGEISQEDIKAVSLLHLDTTASIQPVEKGIDVYITLQDGTPHSISRKYLVEEGEDTLEEDWSQQHPSLFSDEAKPGEFNYNDPNLPQPQPLQKPESLPPPPPSCIGKTHVLIVDPSGFISVSDMVGGTHSKTNNINITIAGESIPAYNSEEVYS